MEETLKHFTLHRSTWESVDVILDPCFHGVTLKVIATMIAIHNDQFRGRPSVQFGISRFDYTTKRGGIDTRPFLSTLWWLSPLNLRATVPSPLLPNLAQKLGPKLETADQAAATA